MSGINGPSLTLNNIKAGATLLLHASKFVPVNNKVTIDVSDIIKVSTDSITTNSNQFRLTDSSGSLTVTFRAFEGQDPSKLLIPINTLALNTANTMAGGIPTMIEPLPGGSISAEILGGSGLSAKPDTVEFDAPIMKIEEGTTYAVLLDGDTEVDRQVLRKRQCETRYAEVEWSSRTNNSKFHVFEVHGQTSNRNEDIELVPEFGKSNRLYPYAQKRSEAVACSLRIKEVTAYDIWYYSDILTSDTVFVHIEGVEYAARIETKSVNIPEGDADRSDFEIDVNLTRYAAY